MRVFESHTQLDAAVKAGAFLFLPEYGPAAFICSECGSQKPINTKGMGGTGYAVNCDTRGFVCYECCAIKDKAEMEKNGRTALYLSKRSDGRHVLNNWPGTLSFEVTSLRIGRHNIAGRRYDVNFRGPDGYWWHGVQYGDNTQLCHCKRTKQAYA